MLEMKDRVLLVGAIGTVLLSQQQSGSPFLRDEVKRALEIAEWAATNVEALFDKEETVPTLLDLAERAMRGEV